MTEDNKNILSKFFQDISENIKNNKFDENEIKYFQEIYYTYNFKKEIIEYIEKENFEDKDFLKLLLILSCIYTILYKNNLKNY